MQVWQRPEWATAMGGVLDNGRFYLYFRLYRHRSVFILSLDLFAKDLRPRIGIIKPVKKKIPSVVRAHQYYNPVYRRVFFCHSTVHRTIALFAPILAIKHPCAESIPDRNVLFISSEYLPSPTIPSPTNSPALYHEPSAYPRDSCNIQKRNRAPVRTLSTR